jgi:hypothetical protein
VERENETGDFYTEEHRGKLETADSVEAHLVQIDDRWWFAINVDDKVVVLDDGQTARFIPQVRELFKVLQKERAKEGN